GGDGISLFGAVFNNTGYVEIDSGSLSFSQEYRQSAGATVLNGGSLAGTIIFNIDGGILAGSGVINASVKNSGQIDVGFAGAAGTLVINGNYTQTIFGVLNLELGNIDAGEFDQFQVNGTVTLDGTVNISLLDSFFARAGDSYHVMTFTS